MGKESEIIKSFNRKKVEKELKKLQKREPENQYESDLDF